MKIKYEFVNETIEIEVDEAWASVMLDLDRQEYNVNHKETRRHCSLDALNLDETLIPSDTADIPEILEQRLHIRSTLAKLEPRQRYLLEQICFLGRSISEVGREEGHHESSVRETLNRAKKNFKKYF